MRRAAVGHVPVGESRRGRPAIRTRTAALLPALVFALAACGTLDPTDDGGPEATRTEPVEDADDTAQAEMTVGDGTFNFQITDCFASEDGIRFTGRSADGDSISGEFDPENPEDATLYVTDKDGEALYSGDETTGEPPQFEATGDGGFAATGTFVSDSDETVDGSISGAC